jgi:hypothetical protein
MRLCDGRSTLKAFVVGSAGFIEFELGFGFHNETTVPFSGSAVHSHFSIFYGLFELPGFSMGCR